MPVKKKVTSGSRRTRVARFDRRDAQRDNRRVDESADGTEVPKAKPGPWRTILVSFAAAGVFAALLASYLVKATKITDAPSLVATSDPPRPGADTLEQAQRVGRAFVEALHAGDTAGAYAQMAQPYRETATLAAFQAPWGNAGFLRGIRSVTFSRTSDRAVQIDGRLVKAATFTATGSLLCAMGPLETTFTFLREGDDAHVLAVFVNGVPVVQGIVPSAPPP
jgi:hypothetical protein